jgi:hypothetical protein
MGTKLAKTADRPLQARSIIVCEGADEYDILFWLRAQRGLCEFDVEIMNAQGRNNLKTLVGDLRFMSGGSALELVAVVMDAEEQNQSDQLLLESLKATAQTQNFKVLIEILPDATTSGSLETLVRRHADASAPAFSCADKWELCIQSSPERSTRAQIDKAWGHVWLAGQGAFHSRLGHALANNAGIRKQLPSVLQHFDALLDEVMRSSL